MGLARCVVRHGTVVRVQSGVVADLEDGGLQEGGEFGADEGC